MFSDEKKIILVPQSRFCEVRLWRGVGEARAEAEGRKPEQVGRICMLEPVLTFGFVGKSGLAVVANLAPHLPCPSEFDFTVCLCK